MMRLTKYILFVFAILLSVATVAQEIKKDVNSLSKDDVLEMTIEELSFYDLEELSKLMDIVGASSLDELYELLLNKDVTSASKSEESVFDSPLSTTVLSHDQMLASGATCFEEALRMVPGVIVRQKTNGNFDVHIRGNDNLPSNNMLLYSENSQTLVMINGRPVFNYSHGGTLWESLPISFEDVDRIEVVRGPSSALYGPNAVSGVINIFTKDINTKSPLVSGNIQGGGLNTLIGDIAFRKQINKKLALGISGNYETRKRERDDLYLYNAYYNKEAGVGKYKIGGVGESLGDGYYTLDEIKRLELIHPITGEPIPNPYSGNIYSYTAFPEKGHTGQLNGVDYTIYSIDHVFENLDQSKNRYAANGYIAFTPNNNTKFDISGGYQVSDVFTTTMGDMQSPLAGKDSKTGYIDLRANIGALNVQTNYNGGTIDFMVGNEGFELDLNQINATAEYDLKFNKMDIRPGLNYQHISYDDSPHLADLGRGYLNGKKDISIIAASMRFDYKPIEKLRLIAALRGENYNHPDEIYASWQLVSSYKINDNNLIRLVYSRANQSSFLVNAHSNYTWNIVNSPYPRVMQFSGNKDYDLLTTDMIELGYRWRPAKNILVDLEAFYTMSDGFGSLSPDYTSVYITNTRDYLLDMTQTTTPSVIPDSVHMQYNNLELKSKQLGASINVDWVINEKLVANAHLTWQQTKLDNFRGISRDNLIAALSTDAATQTLTNYGGLLMNGQINPMDIPQITMGESTSLPTSSQDNYKHKSTPDYFGGFSLTYKPIEKIEIVPQGYFYGEQSFENQYGTIKIDSKFLLNAKVAYKVNNNLKFFVNGRNIFNSKSVEFAYMDEAPMLVLGGVSYKF